ncbi:MAG: hypothetical protein INH03_09440, partial [Rhodocyclaceae bacterium]|nr:hypothetical protein [Rhodocyclaceae bacterium]
MPSISTGAVEARVRAPVLLWRNPPRFAVLHILAVITGGLALDSAFGWTGQHL